MAKPVVSRVRIFAVSCVPRKAPAPARPPPIAPEIPPPLSDWIITSRIRKRQIITKNTIVIAKNILCLLERPIWE
jgi:hypothetical protein